MSLMDAGLEKGQLITERQLDDAVHKLVLTALSIGMIPIAGILSRRHGELHEVLGGGWNHLRAGVPGVHGETGAIIDTGRIGKGYRDLVATSSLSPCPFCQNTLALQMGIKEIRILDAINYTPDFSGYQRVGIQPTVKNHSRIAAVFRKWVNDPANATIWARDIGIYKGKVQKPFDPNDRKRLKLLAEVAAIQGLNTQLNYAEAPVGALILDAQGEVIGTGCSEVRRWNDPSCVAAMSAWRACGGRDHWKDKTLLLTTGPDHIAYSMFHVFNFGQLIVVSDKVFRGRLDDVRKLGVPVTVLNDHRYDEMLQRWLAAFPAKRHREYFGADFVAQ